MTNTAYYDHPSAWRADELTKKADVCFALQQKHIDALDRALQHCLQKNLSMEEINPENFVLNDIQPDIDLWHDEIQHGRGLLVLTGWPSDQYSKEHNALCYWGLSSYFGEAQSQSLAGDRLGHVVGVGGKDTRERAYRNSTELALHTDASDIVAMMCLVQAQEGGLSGYASGPAIYNEMAKNHPELLSILLEGFQYHRFGEHAPGESPVTVEKIPVFSELQGVISISYLRMYIELAFQEMGHDKSPLEQTALDTLDDIAHSPEFRINFMMEPGDIAYFNNYVVLHTRTEFFDSDDEDKKRHLMRLWLRANDARPVNKLIAAFTDRDGIKPQEGKESFYEGSLDFTENIPHRDKITAVS